MDAALKAITVIQFKLEGQVILRNSEYNMNDRLILHTIDPKNGTFLSDGERYRINDTFFPTLDTEDPYRLTEGEKTVIDGSADSLPRTAKSCKST